MHKIRLSKRKDIDLMGHVWLKVRLQNAAARDEVGSRCQLAKDGIVV